MFLCITGCFLSFVMTTENYRQDDSRRRLLTTNELSESISSSSNNSDNENTLELLQQSEDSHFLFQKPVVRDDEDLLFILISKVLSKVLEKSNNINSINNRLYVFMGLGKQHDVKDLLISLYSYLRTARDCTVKDSLDAATIFLFSEPQATRQEVTANLNKFMVITNNKLTMDEKRSFLCLKRKILEKFPWFSTVNREFLTEREKILKVGMEKNIASFGYTVVEFEHFMNYVTAILALSTYTRFLFFKIPEQFIHSFFSPWSIFNEIKDPGYNNFSMLLLCLELVFHLYEIGFVADSCNQYNKTTKINIKGVCNIVQFIGVVFYIQERQKKAKRKNHYLSCEELQAYVEKAYYIANLPANESIIMKNYLLLCQKLNRIKAFCADVREIRCIIGQYLYCNASLFCNVKIKTANL